MTGQCWQNMADLLSFLSVRPRDRRAGSLGGRAGGVPGCRNTVLERMEISLSPFVGGNSLVLGGWGSGNPPIYLRLMGRQPSQAAIGISPLSHFGASGALSGVARRVSANPVTLLGAGFPLDLPDRSGTASIAKAGWALTIDAVRAYPPLVQRVFDEHAEQAADGGSRDVLQ